MSERRVLTREEMDEITDYLRRLALDRKSQGVEVDNPMRREVRPRRGTDEVSITTRKEKKA